MPTTYTKNQNVRVKAVVPEGPVAALRMNEDGEFFYLVQWTDADGDHGDMRVNVPCDAQHGHHRENRSDERRDAVNRDMADGRRVVLDAV